jgi:hypothetical protein
MVQTLVMIAVSVALLAASYFLMWQAGLFAGLGIHGTLAAVLGLTLTTLTGVGLMALIFHSARARYDEKAHGAARKHDQSSR